MQYFSNETNQTKMSRTISFQNNWVLITKIVLINNKSKHIPNHIKLELGWYYRISINTHQQEETTDVHEISMVCELVVVSCCCYYCYCLFLSKAYPLVNIFTLASGRNELPRYNSIQQPKNYRKHYYSKLYFKANIAYRYH